MSNGDAIPKYAVLVFFLVFIHNSGFHCLWPAVSNSYHLQQASTKLNLYSVPVHTVSNPLLFLHSYCVVLHSVKFISTL